MPEQSRPLTIPSGELLLEGRLQLPAALEPLGIVVVCHPHPRYGGSMENNVVDALCEAAVQEGLAALRFNFRGVGRSEGAHEGGDAERGDVRAALSAAATLPGGASVGLAGYSFGAAMAATAGYAGDLRPRALVLVSLPLQMAGAGALCDRGEDCLLLTGDADPICPAETLLEIAARLQPSPACQIVEGADHSWLGYEAELRDTAGSFLRWQLAGRRPASATG